MTPDLGRQLQREKLRRRAMQCGLAGATVFLLLLILDAVTQTVLIAALGASAFIAFAVPRSLHSDPRHLIGGYLVGIAAGVLMSGINGLLHISSPAVDHAVMIVLGALAISLAMFAMVMTKTEHPPAAALALGLVLNEWSVMTLFVIIAGITALSLIKRVVMPILLDLV